jgi:hypothetical protein
MTLEATGGVIQEFFRGVTTLSYGVPHDTHAIVDRIGNRIRSTTSPAG